MASKKAKLIEVSSEHFKQRIFDQLFKNDKFNYRISQGRYVSIKSIKPLRKHITWLCILEEEEKRKSTDVKYVSLSDEELRECVEIEYCDQIKKHEWLAEVLPPYDTSDWTFIVERLPYPTHS